MQEPSLAISSQEAGLDEALRAFAEDEVARLEKLLAARARETSSLTRELDRRSALLREALERLSTTAGSEFEALREARDAAVQRAIEAEVGRAELAFQLDETRGVLQHATGGAASSGPVGELRELYSRIAQLEEADDAQRARLVQAERERDSALTRRVELERQLERERERFELDVAHARVEESAVIAESSARASAQAAAAEADAAQRTAAAEADAAKRIAAVEADAAQRVAAAEADAAQRVAAAEAHGQPRATLEADGAQRRASELTSALRGERDGLRARVLESEKALRGLSERNAQAERQLQAAQNKLADVRAEAAELAVSAQARNTRVSELGLELAREQQELRATRAQLAAAIAAQQAEQRARDSDAQAWQLKLHELESAGQGAAKSTASHAELGRAHELRDFLPQLKAPLLQLRAALDEPGSSEHAAAVALDATTPGTQYDAEVLAALEEKLRASETRCAELETALATRTREVGLHALKGELIDTRADAARLSDDLIKERTRRRRLVVTVRALQAAFESGEAPGPWMEELVSILNEGSSVPPFGHG
jgi:hypothetical protein